MIELTVKTLDSRNHSFSVPDDFTVKQLKDHIAESVNLSPDSQRLIYCGRVLQDDKNLSEYDVNGKVIHLVQRAPPTSNSGGADNNAARTNTSSNPPRRNQAWRTIFQPGANPGNAMYLGAMAFPADLMDAQGISMPQPRQCLSQSRLAVAQGMLRKATYTLNRLENPTSTTSSSSPQESSSDISPDPNANTNVSEEPLASSIALAAQAATAAALAAAVSAAQTSISNLQDLQNDVSSGAEPDTIPDASTTTAESDTSRAAGQQPSPSEEQPTQNANNNATTGSRSRTPRTTALADLLDQLNEVNTRLQPFLAQYHQLMRDDPVLQTSESQQRVFGSVSEIMHFLSHAYHALSDIMCDFSLPPPRYLRCRPVLIQHSAVLQTGIPIQAQINLTSSSSTSQSTPTSTNSTAAPEPTTGSQSAATHTATSDNATNTTTQPPRAQAQASAQGGRSLNLPSGFELFMDVSPGSITIDSLEATVVTNASAATTDATSMGTFPWGSPTPPPEFIQNLMQVLASQIIDGGTRAAPATTTASNSSSTTTQSGTTPAQSAVPGQNSQARGNTATHPTTATQTRSTARPHVHLTPAMQSLGASNFDPFLPCNSHHIRSSRRRASQQQTTSTSSQPSTQQQIPSVQSVQINVVQSGRGRSSQSQEPDRSNNRGSAGRPISPFHNLTQSLFEMSNPDIAAAANIEHPPSAEENTSSEVPEGSSLTLSIFSQLIQRLTGGAAQPTSTLADFLQTLPDYSYTEGESIFMDIFMTLAQSFTFMDMMNLGLGRSECLVRARPQLRRLVSQRLLRNEPANENSINAVVARLNLELRPYFNILSSTRLREEVDLNATINLYNTSMLPRILEAILIEEDESAYRRALLYNCRLYVYELCAIVQYCCLDGNNGMENVIRTFVSQMTNEIPAALQGWTVTNSVVNFRTFITNLNVPIEHIRPFLVYRIGESSHTAPEAQGQEPMETETEPVTENGITSAEVVIPMDAPITVTQSPERMGDVVWQNSLPADWVPIITRDSQRQRRQNSQPPFSDAYLSGMPSKRRKLITSAKPPANLSHVISDSMASALGSAGMGSGPEVEVVAQRASQDPTIRSAYREQVRSTLQNNLQTNPDFKPEKYPNAAKFFDTAK